MKNFSTLLWQFAIVTLWLLSIVMIIRASLMSGFSRPTPSVELSYPWFGVIFTSAVTAIECVFLYLILRPQKYTWSPLRLGIAFGIFLVLSVPANYIFFIFDLPPLAYVPSEFTVLVTTLLLLLLVISVLFWLYKYFFRKDLTT
jgi:hypothetical protein